MWQLAVLLLAGLLAVAVALASTPTGQAFLDVLGARLDDFVFWLQGLFT